MDKRKEENIRVKSAITEALFALMHQKSIAEISITEITRQAGVARMSFYRNYDSKEDVLITLIRDVLEQFRERADYDLSEYCTCQHVYRCFSYFQKYRKYVIDLYCSGFATRLLEELNRFHENIAGTKMSGTAERYRGYMYMGALFNTAIAWLMGGQCETTEEITAVFFENLPDER